MKCDECNEEVASENDLIYRNYGDPVCRPCIKKMYPDHIFDDDSMFLESDLEYHTYPYVPRGGQHVGTPYGCLIVHKPSGVAAVSKDERSMLKNRERAMKILRKAIDDVMRVERNERYGSLME